MHTLQVPQKCSLPDYPKFVVSYTYPLCERLCKVVLPPFIVNTGRLRGLAKSIQLNSA